MKKYALLTMLLALTGTMLSGSLTLLRYYPAFGENLLCSGDVSSNCYAVSQSEYATVFGMPVSAYGLFFYLVILFTVLTAVCARGPYYLYSFIILFPLIVLSLIIDIVLAILLVVLKQFCLLCALTYLTNGLLFVVFVFWCRHLKRQEGTSPREVFNRLVSEGLDRHDKMAVASLYVVFVLFLWFAIFSSTHVLKLKTYSRKLPKAQIARMVKTFYAKTTSVPLLRESRLTIGNKNARIQIVAFTDFLCAACYQLFKIENDLYTKYGDNIFLAYYNYPLDQSCNPHVQRTAYESSCVASRALISAASLGIFKEYLAKHFSRNEEFRTHYSKEGAVDVSCGLANPEMFAKEMDSDAATQILDRDIEFAGKLNIRSTPTLFINGRRLDGVPPREVLEAIMEEELKNH